MNLEQLKAKLVEYEKNLEQAKAMVYRLDGAISVTKELLAELEKPTDAEPDNVK